MTKVALRDVLFGIQQVVEDGLKSEFSHVMGWEVLQG